MNILARFFQRLWRAGLVLALLLPTLITPQPGRQLSTSAVQAAPAPTPSASQSNEAVLGRVYFADRADLERLAGWLDIWEVNHAQGWLLALLNPVQQEQLRRAGYRLVIQTQQTAALQSLGQSLPNQSQGIPGFPCYRTVEETYADMAQLAASHPTLASWVDIGDSWEKANIGVTPGYDLYTLVLTNQAVPGPKPRFFLMAAIHAREYATAETAARFAEHLVSQYGVNPDITWLLNEYEVHVLPLSNPDGRKLAESGNLWRKNTDRDDGCPLANEYGVDLNRNSSFKWGGSGSSTNPCSDIYAGPTPASEPETLAIQNYQIAIFPDQRGPDDSDPAPKDSSGLMITLHSYGDLVLWPWGWTSSRAPNGQALATLGRKLAYFNNSQAGPSMMLYPTTGTTDDWAYGELGVAAYTFEMGNSFFESCSTFENSLYPRNLEALLVAFKAARRPYQDPGGPEVLDLQLPAYGQLGSPLTLRAIATDEHFTPGEPIQEIGAARYSFDRPSWSAGVQTYPLAPGDGDWDTSQEVLTGTLDLSGLEQGRHLVFVEAQDASGSWGVPTAAFVNVLDPDQAGRIQGRVRVAGSLEPLSARLTAGDFQTDNDPDSGFYEMLVLSGTYTLQAQAPGYQPARVTLEVSDGLTITQDFLLNPLCTVLSDSLEAGNPGWSTSTWSLTSATAHSPTQAWTDSPYGLYAPNRDVSLTSPLLDLSGYQDVTLAFWQRYALQNEQDFAYVEFSVDGGQSWTRAGAFTGSQSQWAAASLPLPGLDGQSRARFRFRLVTDESGQADGWYVDDIVLNAGSPACGSQPIPLSGASLSLLSNASLYAGQSAHFGIDLQPQPASKPYTYTIDFGDLTPPLTGTSSLDPLAFTHTFSTGGAYTLTFSAWNLSVAQPVTATLPLTVFERGSGKWLWLPWVENMP